MPEYTLLVAIAIVALLLVEFGWLRTGIFRMPEYAISMAIVIFFQCLVDGWLTKLRAPIVLYDDAQTLGTRFPFDIPIEDFGFGAVMVTLTMMLWLRVTRARGEAIHESPEAPGSRRPLAPPHEAPSDEDARA